MPNNAKQGAQNKKDSTKPKYNATRYQAFLTSFPRQYAIYTPKMWRNLIHSEMGESIKLSNSSEECKKFYVNTKFKIEEAKRKFNKSFANKFKRALKLIKKLIKKHAHKEVAKFIEELIENDFFTYISKKQIIELLTFLCKFSTPDAQTFNIENAIKLSILKTLFNNRRIAQHFLGYTDKSINLMGTDIKPSQNQFINTTEIIFNSRSTDVINMFLESFSNSYMKRKLSKYLRSHFIDVMDKYPIDKLSMRLTNDASSQLAVIRPKNDPTPSSRDSENIKEPIEPPSTEEFEQSLSLMRELAKNNSTIKLENFIHDANNLFLSFSNSQIIQLFNFICDNYFISETNPTIQYIIITNILQNAEVAEAFFGFTTSESNDKYNIELFKKVFSIILKSNSRTAINALLNNLSCYKNGNLPDFLKPHVKQIIQDAKINFDNLDLSLGAETQLDSILGKDEESADDNCDNSNDKSSMYLDYLSDLLGNNIKNDSQARTLFFTQMSEFANDIRSKDVSTLKLDEVFVSLKKYSNYSPETLIVLVRKLTPFFLSLNNMHAIQLIEFICDKLEINSAQYTIISALFRNRQIAEHFLGHTTSSKSKANVDNYLFRKIFTIILRSESSSAISALLENLKFYYCKDHIDKGRALPAFLVKEVQTIIKENKISVDELFLSLTNAAKLELHKITTYLHTSPSDEERLASIYATLSK